MAALKPLRRLAPSHKALYLTFDDGPDPQTTPAVLDLLAQHGARATFFVVAQTAAPNVKLLHRILDSGHTLGNHSLDHAYRPFFQSSEKLKGWIEKAEAILQDLSGRPTVGFRPPAGVQTPPLRRVLHHLNQPLVLWNTRFYDALWAWRSEAALASLRRARAGDIVLLHDRQSPTRRERFLKTLEIYLQAAHAQNFTLESLSRELTAAQKPVSSGP